MAGVAPLLRGLEALPRAKGGANGQWRARCPAHDDDGPSLGWRVGDDGRVLLLCRAGCRTEDVVAALGARASATCSRPRTRSPRSRASGAGA